MNTLIEKTEYKGFEIELHYDDLMPNPLDTGIYMGNLVFHPESEFATLESRNWEKYRKEKYAVRLEHYLLWIPSKDQLPNSLDEAKEWAEETYKAWLTWMNTTYSLYVIRHRYENRNGYECTKVFDSCGGFTNFEECLEYAKNQIDSYENESQIKERIEK